MKCPQCGRDASLIGLPNHIYPTAQYRCYSHGEYTFSVNVDSSPEAAAEAEASAATSRQNAADMLAEREK